ncbi:RluA family pseudouridine synthase, partial [bacterium]|nr:RluA family pseudouridine synthase [bacterium]
MLKFKITAKDEGKRLDIVIAEHLKTSRSYVKFLIDNDYVKINSLKGKPSYKVIVGDQIVATIPIKQETLESDINVPIIYKNKDFAIYNKPWGMSVHPNESRKPRSEVMLTDIINRDFPKIKDRVERMGIVHRLDKNTSGLIIVSLNNKFSLFIKDQFKLHEIKKTYKALVLGKIKPEKGIIDAPIVRSGSLEGRMTISSENEGRIAKTNYKVDKYLSDRKNKYSLLSVYPKTGRTHQIRVHLSSIGHPIVGDKLYGYDKNNAKRQLLHAEGVEFTNLES